MAGPGGQWKGIDGKTGEAGRASQALLRAGGLDLEAK